MMVALLRNPLSFVGARTLGIPNLPWLVGWYVLDGAFFCVDLEAEKVVGLSSVSLDGRLKTPMHLSLSLGRAPSLPESTKSIEVSCAVGFG